MNASRNTVVRAVGVAFALAAAPLAAEAQTTTPNTTPQQTSPKGKDAQGGNTQGGNTQGSMTGQGGSSGGTPAPSPATDPYFTYFPPVTTYATRTRRSLTETPGNVIVIEREEMDRRQMVTIEDLVRNQPGVRVNRQTSGTDPFNSLGGFTVRGVGGNRVQTLVDGSRVIERITDQTRDFVDLSNMKRVEIIRGPGSVLWGADALGGIVAFTTKDPLDYLTPGGKPWAVQIGNVWNSFNDAFTENITLAGRYGRWSALVSYTRRDANQGKLSKAKTVNGVWPCTRAPESNPCNRLDPTDIISDNVLAKVVWDVDKYNQFKLTGEYFRRVTDVDQLWDNGRGVAFGGGFSTTETLDYSRQQDLTRYRISLEQDWKTRLSFLDRLKWQLTYHPQTLDRSGDRYRRNAASEITRRRDFLGYNEKFYEADIQFTSSFNLGPSKHTLIYGFDGDLTFTDYERRDLNENLTLGTSSTRIAGGFNFANARTIRADVFLQDEISFLNRRIILTPGLRFSTYSIKPNLGEGYRIVPGREPKSQFEQNLSFQFGGIFKFDKEYSIYARYAEGFKMPTAQQLYTSLPGTFFNLVPNPNLKPESVRSFEVGLRGKFPKGYFSVNMFYARYKNFIQNFVSIPGTIDITYDNLSRVQIWGVEGKAAWRVLPEWEISGAFSYQRGDQKANENSGYSPFNAAEPFQFVGGIKWIKPKWGLEVEFVGTFQAGVTRTDDTPRPKFRPGSYMVFDMNAQWKPHKNVTLRLSIFNLTDERYFLSSASSFDRTPSSDAVAATNPLELQTQPGRTFLVGATIKF